MPCLLPPNSSHPKVCACGESSSRRYWYEDSHYWEVPEAEEEEDDEEAEREKLHSLRMLVRDIEMANARKAELEAELNHGDVEVVVDSNEEGNGEGKKTE